VITPKNLRVVKGKLANDTAKVRINQPETDIEIDLISLVTSDGKLHDETCESWFR
jgi:hypothetical protein